MVGAIMDAISSTGPTPLYDALKCARLRSPDRPVLVWERSSSPGIGNGLIKAKSLAGLTNHLLSGDEAAVRRGKPVVESYG